ncbi:conserved hypothetical protein [Candidatus Jettenia caeni]|uniref:Uncharacterized protein n=1 Tax=Candidatus Jettenia caeni TaxID=247490 RepID=I3IQR1_9BACT|nr:conserved hypothetical protein [Candidatus Jettenia caeni]
MTIENRDIDAMLQKVEKLLSEEKGLLPAMRSMVGLLALVITLMVGHLNRNSRTSSKPRRQAIRIARGKAVRKVRGRQEGKRVVME